MVNKLSYAEEIRTLFRYLSNNNVASKTISEYALKKYKEKKRPLVVSIVYDQYSARAIKSNFEADSSLFFEAYICAPTLSQCKNDERIDFDNARSYEIDPEKQYLLNIYAVDRLNPRKFLNNIPEYKLCKIVPLWTANNTKPIIYAI